MNDLLSQTQIQNELRVLVGWKLEDDKLVKKFIFKNFMDAMDFMQKIAGYAERMNHHPDWSNTYKTVHVSLTTHSAGGVTSLDIRLAQCMETVFNGATK